MEGHLEEPIWDGNGGTLDPKKTSQRDLLVALHVKVDQVIIPGLKDLSEFRRKQENGELTRAQTLAMREIIQNDKDANLNRRNLKTPVWALVISFLALLTSVVLTIQAFTGGQL